MIVTTEGLRRLLLKMSQNDLNTFKVAIGSGTTAPTVNDVALENQIAIDESPDFIEVVENVLYITGFFDTTITGSINEIGLFDATDDMLIAREVLADTKSKTVNDTYMADCTIQLVQL